MSDLREVRLVVHDRSPTNELPSATIRPMRSKLDRASSRPDMALARRTRLCRAVRAPIVRGRVPDTRLEVSCREVRDLRTDTSGGRVPLRFRLVRRRSVTRPPVLHRTRAQEQGFTPDAALAGHPSEEFAPLRESYMASSAVRSSAFWFGATQPTPPHRARLASTSPPALVRTTRRHTARRTRADSTAWGSARAAPGDPVAENTAWPRSDTRVTLTPKVPAVEARDRWAPRVDAAAVCASTTVTLEGASAGRRTGAASGGPTTTVNAMSAAWGVCTRKVVTRDLTRTKSDGGDAITTACTR